MRSVVVFHNFWEFVPHSLIQTMLALKHLSLLSFWFGGPRVHCLWHRMNGWAFSRILCWPGSRRLSWAIWLDHWFVVSHCGLSLLSFNSCFPAVLPFIFSFRLDFDIIRRQKQIDQMTSCSGIDVYSLSLSRLSHISLVVIVLDVATLLNLSVHLVKLFLRERIHLLKFIWLSRSISWTLFPTSCVRIRSSRIYRLISGLLRILHLDIWVFDRNVSVWICHLHIGFVNMRVMDLSLIEMLSSNFLRWGVSSIFALFFCPSIYERFLLNPYSPHFLRVN